MRTPKEYTDNLKKGIITPFMLEDVLFSFNKRAKNYRDRARVYRERRRYYGWNDKYDNEELCEEKKEILYGKKSDILNCCPNELKAIHKLARKKKIRIEDDDPEFYKYESEIEKYKKGKPSKIVYMNGYYDDDIDEYITFFNIYVDKYEYFLYYEFPNYSFHSPISDKELLKYQFLEIIELDDLTTYGKNINDLLSLQFCDKVWDLLMKS